MIKIQTNNNNKMIKKQTNKLAKLIKIQTNISIFQEIKIAV